MKKRGLSQVVSTVVLIALTIAIVASTWSIINNFIDTRLDNSEKCSKIYEKIILNDEFTCYDSDTNTMMISISRSDFELDSLLVGVMGNETSNSFTLKKTSQLIENIWQVKDFSSGIANKDTILKLPDKESGLTYCVDNVLKKPVRIEIAPTIGGVGCPSTDTTSIVNCGNYKCSS